MTYNFQDPIYISTNESVDEELNRLRQELKDAFVIFSFLIQKYGEYDEDRDYYVAKIELKDFFDFTLKVNENKLVLERTDDLITERAIYYRVREI